MTTAQSPLEQPYNAIDWFIHAVGSMVERQRELAKATARHDTRERIGQLMVDVEEAWQELQPRWGAVNDTPEVLADVCELAILVGGQTPVGGRGPHPATPTYEPPTGGDAARYNELMARLAKHSVELKADTAKVDKAGATPAPEPAGNARGDKPKTSRKHRQSRPRPATAKQLQAAEIYGECKGNYSKGARAMGIGRASFKQHVEAAYAKVGQAVPSQRKLTKLTTDHRGGVDIAAGSKPRFRGDGKDRSQHDCRRD